MREHGDDSFLAMPKRSLFADFATPDHAKVQNETRSKLSRDGIYFIEILHHEHGMLVAHPQD